jgi:hypothetical protein
MNNTLGASEACYLLAKQKSWWVTEEIIVLSVISIIPYAEQALRTYVHSLSYNERRKYTNVLNFVGGSFLDIYLMMYLLYWISMC